MKKTVLSLMAIVAFAVTFAGTAVKTAMDPEEAWFHITDANFSNPMEAPRCAQPEEELCALKYERDDENSPWVLSSDPVNEAYGIPF